MNNTDKPKLSWISVQSFYLCHLFYLLRHYLLRHLFSFLYLQTFPLFWLVSLTSIHAPANRFILCHPRVFPFWHKLLPILSTLCHQFFLTPHPQHNTWHFASALTVQMKLLLLKAWLISWLELYLTFFVNCLIELLCFICYCWSLLTFQNNILLLWQL